MLYKVESEQCIGMIKVRMLKQDKSLKSKAVWLAKTSISAFTEPTPMGKAMMKTLAGSLVVVVLPPTLHLLGSMVDAYMNSTAPTVLPKPVELNEIMDVILAMLGGM